MKSDLDLREGGDYPAKNVTLGAIHKVHTHLGEGGFAQRICSKGCFKVTMTS